MAMCSRSVPLAACGCTALARSTKDLGLGSRSAGNRDPCSPSTCSGSRLVARPAPAATQEHRRTMSATAAATLAVVDHDERWPVSQRSITRSVGAVDPAVVAERSGTPTATATASATAPASTTGAELPNQTSWSSPARGRARAPTGTRRPRPVRRARRDARRAAARELRQLAFAADDDVRASGSDADPGNGDARGSVHPRPGPGRAPGAPGRPARARDRGRARRGGSRGPFDRPRAPRPGGRSGTAR